MASRAMQQSERRAKPTDGADQTLDSGTLGALLSEISAEISELSHKISAGTLTQHLPNISRPDSLSFATQLAHARSILRLRRRRDGLFPEGMFGEAAWDMLLDLFVAKAEGRQVAVSSACIASAVPPTTALRWLRTLIDGNMIQRRPDPRDGRRVWVELTLHSEELLRAALIEP